MKKQNFDEAKQLLGKAINLNDSKSESALKELAYLLQREGDIDAALNLVKNNSDKIKTFRPK
ncbi:MAG: hypothetical protein HC905_00150 [Bacteroidales bacterium]|nr:hypothetical protein [Bacteroidales bacterium]